MNFIASHCGSIPTGFELLSLWQNRWTTNYQQFLDQRLVCPITFALASEDLTRVFRLSKNMSELGRARARLTRQPIKAVVL